MKIEFYKIPNGFIFCQDPAQQAYSYPKTDFQKYLVAGQVPERTNSPNWWRVRTDADSLLPVLSPESRKIVKTFHRRRPDAPDVLPEILPYGEVPDALSSSYFTDHEYEDVPRQELDVTLTCLGTIAWISEHDPAEFSYRLQAETAYDGCRTDGNLTAESIFQQYPHLGVISVSDIQRATQPSFAWHLGPCSISSHTFYRLIRAAVLDSHNPAVAQITSNYDFVFEVKKRISCRPFKVEYYQPFARTKKARNKIHIRQEKEKLISVLYITHKQHVHGTEHGAKIVPDLHGENLDDLLTKIDTYLTDTLSLINAPVSECPTCFGTGFQEVSVVQLPRS